MSDSSTGIGVGIVMSFLALASSAAEISGRISFHDPRFNREDNDRMVTFLGGNSEVGNGIPDTFVHCFEGFSEGSSKVTNRIELLIKNLKFSPKVAGTQPGIPITISNHDQEDRTIRIRRSNARNQVAPKADADTPVHPYLDEGAGKRQGWYVELASGKSVALSFDSDVHLESLRFELLESPFYAKPTERFYAEFSEWRPDTATVFLHKGRHFTFSTTNGNYKIRNVPPSPGYKLHAYHNFAVRARSFDVPSSTNAHNLVADVSLPDPLEGDKFYRATVLEFLQYGGASPVRLLELLDAVSPTSRRMLPDFVREPSTVPDRSREAIDRELENRRKQNEAEAEAIRSGVDRATRGIDSILGGPRR